MRSASHCAGSGVMKARWLAEVVQVLAGVVDVDDVGGVRVELLGHGPDPGGAVAEGDDLAEVLAAAAQVLGLDQSGEGVLAVEGGHVGGGAGVHHRPAVLIQAGHGEEPGELDLAGAGLAVLAFARPAFGFAGADGHAGPVDLDVEHVGDRLGGRQRDDRAGARSRRPRLQPAARGGRAGGLGGPLDGPGGLTVIPASPASSPAAAGERRPPRRPGRSSRPGPATAAVPATPELLGRGARTRARMPAQ